jgi:tryptophanyl-tRNA synthetase
MRGETQRKDSGAILAMQGFDRVAQRGFFPRWQVPFDLASKPGAIADFGNRIARRRKMSDSFFPQSEHPMRILSGIQPSGVVHIGNYFGMMRPAIALQAEGEAFYFIADYHALTSLKDPATLRENSRGVAIDFLACGLDPERAALFLQSDVPQVTELAWILSTIAPMGLLERAHSYKDKIARGMTASAGLFTYPVLMAADILIYDSDFVPVGKDQKQHIEITRDLAVKMNETFGEIFKLPEPRINSATETVPGIDGQKMSKSYGNTIDIFGDEKETRKRVMSIVTDSSPVEAPKDPGSSTILQLYSLFATEEETAAMREAFRRGGTGYGDFKKQLFAKLWDYFEPMRKRRAEILDDPHYVDGVLERGAQRANEVASKVMARVREAVGL